MKLMLALLIFSCLAPVLAEARTRVFIKNQLDVQLKAVTKVVAVTPKTMALDKTYWAQPRKIVLPRERIEILWFSRDEGIREGKAWAFQTTVKGYGPGIGSLLRQRVGGRMVGSKLYLGLDSEHSFTDREWHTQKVYPAAAGKRAIEIKYRAYFTGGDDDIEYIIRYKK